MSTFTRLVGCELPIQQAPAGSAAGLPALPLADFASRIPAADS